MLQTTNYNAPSFCRCCPRVPSTPPNVVIQSETAAMLANVRQSDSSHSVHWRDDPPQEDFILFFYDLRRKRSPFESIDLHVDASFGATTCISSLWNHRLFSKSSGHMFASHASNHGCLVTFACLATASRKASFLGVHPSERQKHTEKTLKHPLTFTHA